MRQGSVSIRGSMRPAWPTILRGSLRLALLTVLCFVLSANAVQAAAVITCSIAEGPGIVDGVLGIGDTVTVTAIASYGPGTSMIHMSADLSSLGLSPVATMTSGGGMNYSYTSGSLLPAMLPGTNYLQRTFAVRAIDNLGGMAIGTTNAHWVDNVAPAGNLAAVSPATVSGGNTVTVTIRDANYQSTPGGGTTAIADLGPTLPPPPPGGRQPQG